VGRSTSHRPTTAVVIPCYNEESRLDVDAFVEFVLPRPWLTFLFVDDGSTDGTADVIAAAASRCPERIRSVTMPRNVGKGEASRHGIQTALEAGPDLFAYWDADLATPLTDIDLFRDRFVHEPELEIALASRVRLLGHHIERRAARHYFGRVAATLVSALLDIPVYDTQCGAKMFRATPRVREIFAQPFVTRWTFDVEILARWLTQVPPDVDIGSHIEEVPLRIWTDVAGSKLRLRDFMRAPVDLWHIYRHYGRAPRRRA
jgi:glycosyltransferase involved in cell wall biosynthesis